MFRQRGAIFDLSLVRKNPTKRDDNHLFKNMNKNNNKYLYWTEIYKM